MTPKKVNFIAPTRLYSAPDWTGSKHFMINQKLISFRLQQTCEHILKWSNKAKKYKFSVSKLPRAFVFRCAFDSAKFKVWIFFFACLIFFPVFYELVKIYKKRYDRHNETLWTTGFFNSVFCLLSCSSKIKFQFSKLWMTQIWHVCCSERKKKKKKTC